MTLDRLYKGLLTAFFSLLMLTTAPCNADQSKTLLVVRSSDADYYQVAAQQFIDTLYSQNSAVNIQQIHAGELKELQEFSPDLLIAIGSKAATASAQLSTDTRILNILLPRTTHLAITSETDLSLISGIYLDQPAYRLVNLTRLLPFEIKRVGAITRSGETTAMGNALKQQFSEHGIDFSFRQLDEKQKPIQVLRPLFSEIDAFIALPDSSIFTRALAKWILNFSLQQQIPVIGFSSAYSDAGALLSVYSSPEQIGRQAAEVVSDWLNNGQFPDSFGIAPRYFTVKVNYAVLRRMEINTHTMRTADLQTRLEALENNHE